MTTLNSVDVTTASMLGTSDVLAVERREAGGFPIVAAFTDAAAQVGTIIDNIEVLLDCLSRGRSYVAVVLQPPVGAEVWVEVSSSS